MTIKALQIKTCEDCPFIRHGLRRNWCVNPQNERSARDLSEVNIDAAIPDWCELEDAK